jgi:hypothetical protein
MNTIGQLPPEVRTYRVRLSRIAFYEVEITAQSADAAMQIAETAPPTKPKVDFYTELVAFRAQIYQPWDGGKWVDATRA